MEKPVPVEAPKNQKNKPFNLCFIDKHLQGRSEIHIDRPLKLPPTITDKFYTNISVEVEKNEKVIDEYIERLRFVGPREKYRHPITENQRYGWYQVQLVDNDRSDRRLCFNKRPNILIKEHLMNYAKIRDS